MHSKVKLSKREIKEDKFTSFVLTAKDQLMESWQYGVIAVVVLALVIGGIVFWFSNRSNQQMEAGTKLSKAVSDYRGNNLQVALLGLGQIVESYSGEAAEQATFLLGQINLESKNYTESRKYFEQYLSKYSGDKFKRAAAMAGLGGCLEGEAKYSEAAAKYLEAIAEYPEGPQVQDFQISVLRDYLDANDVAKARAQLGMLKKTYKGDARISRAEMMYAEKATKH